ncbi:MAG: ATP-binding protein [Gemmataceae bacterium]|nr:ATP-binding protein [Gemmataceae bacterium]
MFIPSRRACLWSAAGALLVTALLASVLALRAEQPLLAVGNAWPELLLAAALAWGLALAAIVVATHRYRCALTQLAAALDTARKRPSAVPLTEPGHELLGPIAAPLAALCNTYRRALAELAARKEALESLRDADRSAGKTVLIERGSGSSRNMVARLTRNLSWMTATSALQQFLGCSAADLNGRRFAEIVNREDREILRRAFTEALQVGEAHNILFRVRCRIPSEEGPEQLGENPSPTAERERHVQMDVMTRQGEDGAPLHFRCFLVDVTERVRAEQALRHRTDELIETNEQLVRINEDLERLKESYRDLYQRAPALYFSLNAHGLLIGFNDTLCHALGYARAELFQQPYTALLPAECLEPYLADPGVFQRQGEVETRWRKKDGTVIDVWIRSVPLEDEEGTFVRSRSAAQDVTERNRLADELRRRGDELERANTDLRQINKELDEFTSVVSHDLKEPLRTIDAFSTFLAQDYSQQLGPDGFECVNHLVTASRRLARLIDDLLTLCRAGRITTTPRPFNLNEAVATVRRDLADMVTRREATIHTEGSLPVVLGDPERVTQLLSNLVANGLKYNHNPCPRVVIGEAGARDEGRGAREEGRGGVPSSLAPGFVTLYVRDNGIGIDPEHHQQIFGIFRRLHQRDQYEGTGAGLAICQKIVEAHLGEIWVESQPGQGATFYFTLPRAPTEAARPSGTVPRRSGVVVPGKVPPQGNGQVPARSSGARLLLVEDMAEIGLVVQRLARRSGHTVEWVSSAEQAWEYLHAQRPALVLLDIHLPGMNGVELCRKLRASARHADLPIALFSQGANEDDLRGGLEAGANFVLSKDLLSQPDAWQQHIEALLAAARRS